MRESSITEKSRVQRYGTPLVLTLGGIQVRTWSTSYGTQNTFLA